MKAKTGLKLLALTFLLAVSAVLAVPSAGHAEAVRARITFLLYCDVYEMGPNAAGRGGMARINGVIAAERASGHPVIVAHGGDTISPSLMSGLDKGESMMDLIGTVAPDVFVPGNHEFDFGTEVFMKRMAEATWPVLAANMTMADGKPVAGIRPSEVFEVDGITIGMIGLTAEDNAERSSPGPDLAFQPSVDTAVREVAAMRAKGVDLVVLLVHERREIDRQLIDAAGADIILSGDDHDLLVAYDGKVAFAEAMQDGLYMTAVDVDVSVTDKDGRRKVRWWPNFRIIDTAAAAPDKATEKKVAGYEAELSKELDVPIGRTGTELDSRNAAVRGGEAVIGNLYADAIRAETGAEIALLNGGGLRANRLYPAGTEITRRDVLAELPFGNLTFVMEISGADFLATLEQGFAKAENLTGGFPQVSGLRVKADLSRPVGERVVSVEIGGAPLDPARTYRLATNDFLARGGDGYTALARGRIVVGDADAKLIANHVMSYIRAKGTVAPVLDGRVFVGRTATPK